MKLFLRLLTGSTVLAVVLWLYFAGKDSSGAFEWNRAVESVKQLPDIPFLAAFAIFPLVGFPISVFLAMAGLKFGFMKAMLLSAVAVYFHNAVAYWLGGQLFRDPLQAFLEKRNQTLPEIKKDHQKLFTFVYTAVPGIPYAPKIYLLSLAGLPFWIYFWIGGTTYAVSNAMYVFMGTASEGFDPLLWVIAGVLMLCGIGLTFWLKKRYHPHDREDRE